MRNSLFLILSVALLASSCRFVRGERVRGNGNVQTENRAETGFSGISSYGSFDVFVSTDSKASVKIEAEENLLPYIETYVDGNVLKIDTKDGFHLSPQRSIKVYVAAPEFHSIHSNGAGDITGLSKIISTSSLDVQVNGSADVKLEVDVPNVEIGINGSGNISLTGKTKTFKSSVFGDGDLDAIGLLSEKTDVNITGNGNAEVFASLNLQVRITGNGDVRYKGDGQVSSNITGNGSVKKLN